MVQSQRVSVFVSGCGRMVEQIAQFEISGITSQSVYGRDVMQGKFFDRMIS
jgi:hypothetical protein